MEMYGTQFDTLHAEAMAAVASSPKLQRRNKALSQTSDSYRSRLDLLRSESYGDCKMSGEDSGYASPAESDHCDDVKRTTQDCIRLYKEGLGHMLTDDEILFLAKKGTIAGHALERVTGDATRAVRIRRELIADQAGQGHAISSLPYHSYDFSQAAGRCAENVIGYMPIPVGVAGPLMVDGQKVVVPMATIEGALIASTSRGCKALNSSPSGVSTVVTSDGMTRAPVVEFSSAVQAGAAKAFMDSAEGTELMKKAFESTTSYGKVQSVTTRLAGKYMYIRIKATTGEAMGMNMISKGTEELLRTLQRDSRIPEMRVIAISGNVCSDKKPAAINWIEGRGKSVVAECVIPASTLASVLKTDAKRMAKLNVAKNYVGSAMAGAASGGCNAHAANIVAAIFMATGQDVAQVGTSSNCLTMFEEMEDGSLYASVTMPSIEVGTIGGGTHLTAQCSMLNLLGVKEGGPRDGSNSARLARIIAATVLAGELSLCSALTSGDLVSSHMKHNRA